MTRGAHGRPAKLHPTAGALTHVASATLEPKQYESEASVQALLAPSSPPAPRETGHVASKAATNSAAVERTAHSVQSYHAPAIGTRGPYGVMKRLPYMAWRGAFTAADGNG